MANIDIMNIKNWKRTSKKQYEVYVCRPVIGTQVINKLDKKEYTTSKQEQFVISGTLGEQQVIDVKTLVREYEFMDGSEINAASLKKNIVNSDSEIDWMHLKRKSDKSVTLTEWAFHLPASHKNFAVNAQGDLANATGLSHGLGDFLVCRDVKGAPDLNSMKVVNGIVFPTTYDMRAFPGVMAETSKRMKGKNLEKTVVPSKSLIGKKVVAKDAVENSIKKVASGAKRTEYQLTGRYMVGNVTVGYHLHSMTSDKSGRYTREQVCYLLGRGQITNCTGSVNQGRVIIRGKGMNLDSLPVVEVDESEKRDKSRAGASKQNAVNKFELTGKIKHGNSIVGYVISNAGHGQKKVNKKQFIELIKDGRISNATYQICNGQEVMRGIGISLKELPVYGMEDKLA